MKKLLVLVILATVSYAATIENGSFWSAGGNLNKVELEFRPVPQSTRYEWRVNVWDEETVGEGEWTEGAHVDSDGNLSHTDGSAYGPLGNEFHAKRGHPSKIKVNSAGQRLSIRMKKHAKKPGVTL